MSVTLFNTMNNRCSLSIASFGLFFAAGCAATPATQPSDCGQTDPQHIARGPAASLPDAFESSRVLYDSAGRPHLLESAPDQNLAVASDPASRFQTRSIGPTHKPPTTRPRRVGRRDIKLHHARLDNAFRLLANVGKFNLVVQGDFTKTVSLALRRVEPYDALLALAQSNQARVELRDNIVVVAHASQ